MKKAGAIISRRLIQLMGAAVAFSSEVAAGSREENASNKKLEPVK
jgi:hypothetical protein